jgi:MFS transporter, DHA2 family, multidrug resistance protein
MAESPSVPLPAGEYAPLRGISLVLLTLAVAVSSFMEILDMTIVNVSLPSIAGSLGVSPAEGTWAISSYMLAAAVVQPLAGWIGRRFGEVRTFVTSIALFVVFSALCGLATSMPMLIAGRIVQGLVSGPMMSVAQALLLRNYPPHLRGLAMGLWAMVVIIAPIFGPILGGTITDNLSWPWLFYLNVPVGIAAAITSWALLKKRESKTVRVPIDVVGLVLLVVGVSSLQFMLDNGNEKDWFSSPIILAAAAVAVVALTFLIAWELTDEHPIVDLHLFKRRNFLIGSLSVAVAFFAFSGVNVLYPLWLQTTLGYTSTMAGYAIAPVGIVALFVAPLIGKNMHKINLRAAVTFAYLVFSTSLFLVSTLNDQASFSQLSLPRLLQGVGLAFFFLPLNQIVMSGVTASELASAAGLSNFLRTIAGSISTAMCIWIWNDRSEFHHAILSEHLRPDAAGFIAYQSQLATQGVTDTAFAAMDRTISVQATTMGANDVFLMLCVLYIFLIPLVWYSRPPFGSAGSAKLG